MPSELSHLGLEFGQQVYQIIADLLTDTVSPASLSAMEHGVRETLLKLGNFLLSTWLALQNQRYPDPTIPCRCGATAQYREMRPGVLITLLGRIAYRRAYYLCATCQEGTYPLDHRLGLRPGQMSAALEDLAAQTGVQLPFGQGSDLFAQLTLVRLSPQSMDTATQAVGAERQAVETEWIATSQDATALLDQERETPPVARLYGTLDATKVHIVEPSDPAASGWRDLKVGAWFETDAQPPAQPDDDAWDIQARDITYFCDIQEAADFGDLLWATGFQRRAPRAAELVFVADGAPWIWNLVQEHYPQAVQIVDWFHASAHLTPVAALASSTAEECAAWRKKARDDLWHGRLTAVIAACADLVTTGDQNDPAQQAVTYFTNNQQRMDYPTYRARGYQIGSGTVESGCKQIGTQRLKVPGARWSLAGARKVAKARAAHLSREWQPLVQRRVHLDRAA
ncbi:MAG: ISKra4 family transposase [Chloroflexi bacterium]|nr:ISKra4 family transposase [Chloroflexota bacterium]MBU1750041.1 ISKra4 family transposase [Chloroflexota bacterium]